MELKINECYEIKVKKYMTKKSVPDFDFMKKFNNDNPMPFLIMVGEVIKETPKMVYMKMHGDITQIGFDCCLKCGCMITNPVSRYFRLGPFCGGHSYENPFKTEEALIEALALYRNDYLSKIVWEGWIPKSAIVEKRKITSKIDYEKYVERLTKKYESEDLVYGTDYKRNRTKTT